MAKVVAEQTRVVVQSEWQEWVKIIGTGAGVGLLVYLIGLLIGQYIVEPFMCRNVVDLASCADASVLAGRISSVLLAVAAIFALIKLTVARPLIVAVSAVAVLWDLSLWTAGLVWFEALAWSVVLYALSYALFGWIARHAHLIVSLVTALIVIIVIRLALALS